MLIKSFVDIDIDVIGGNVSNCLSVKRGSSFVESQTWKMVFSFSFSFFFCYQKVENLPRFLGAGKLKIIIIRVFGFQLGDN